MLQEFEDLGRMSICFETPVLHTEKTERIPPEMFANLRQDVYPSIEAHMDVNASSIKGIPVFTMEELQTCFSCMRNRRGADKCNIVVEMVKHAGTSFHTALLGMYNDIIMIGAVPIDWHITVFTMLPKLGDLKMHPIGVQMLLYQCCTRCLHFGSSILNSLRSLCACISWVSTWINIAAAIPQQNEIAGHLH